MAECEPILLEIEIDYQNIGGKFSVFTNEFLNREKRSHLIVFTEPNAAILSNTISFDEHLLLKSERVAVLYNKEIFDLIASEIDTEVIYSIFKVKDKNYEICLISLYFNNNVVKHQIERWNKIIAYINKLQKENRLLVLVGDPNEKCFYDKISKQPVKAGVAHKQVFAQIKRIFESLALHQVFPQNKGFLDICGTNAIKYNCYEVPNVIVTPEKVHSSYRLRIASNETRKYSNILIAQVPYIEQFGFEEFSFKIVEIVSHFEKSAVATFISKKSKINAHIFLNSIPTKSIEGKKIIVADNVKNVIKQKLFKAVALTIANKVITVDEQYEIGDFLQLDEFDDDIECAEAPILPPRKLNDLEMVTGKLSIENNALKFNDVHIKINKQIVKCQIE